MAVFKDDFGGGAKIDANDVRHRKTLAVAILEDHYQRAARVLRRLRLSRTRNGRYNQEYCKENRFCWFSHVPSPECYGTDYHGITKQCFTNNIRSFVRVGSMMLLGPRISYGKAPSPGLRAAPL